MVKIDIPTKAEDLKPKDLERAQGLAGVLTKLRQVSYVTVDILVMVWVINYAYNYIVYPLDIIVVIIGILYALFKVRDFIRGDN